MHIRTLSAGLLMLVTCCVGGQNLVPNPSFEEITACPTFASMLDLAAPWHNPTTGTPELYHGCAPNGDFAGVPSNASGGYQFARTGQAFAGLYVFRAATLNMREYIQVPLVQPLAAGRCYRFTMYVNMPDDFELACDGIGVHFSTGAVQGNTQLLLPLPGHIDNPVGALIQDTVAWVPVTGVYTAVGGEGHLTVGNFRSDAQTTWALLNPGTWYTDQAYLLVDDVSLMEVVDDLDLGADTLLCAGTVHMLDATVPGATAVVWNDGSTDAMRTVDQAGTYSVTVTAGGCTFQDTVVVHIAPAAALELGPDGSFCAGLPVVLRAITTAGATVVWSDGTVGAERVVDVAGMYYATCTTPCGTSTDSVRVMVDECPEAIHLPNAFTPDGDGINDAFKPIYDPRMWAVEFTIHDRWGRQLFTSTGTEWSAAEVPIGVYVVRLHARSRTDDEHRAVMGHVAVVR